MHLCYQKKFIMIKVIRCAPKNVAAFEAKGKVTAKDFDRVFDHVEKVVNRTHELNYLLKLDTHVLNFSKGAWVQDLLLGISNLSRWNRCAIVTDDIFVDKATQMFNMLPIGEFRVFEKKDFKAAKKWASTGIDETKPARVAAIAAGLGGALALNILHESLRKNADNAPAINEVAEEGLDRILDGAGINLNENELYTAALVGDVVSNSLYYAATATGKLGIFSGILGGLAAVSLPKYIGLDDEPVASTRKKRLMTVAYYTLGAVITKALFDRFRHKD